MSVQIAYVVYYYASIEGEYIVQKSRERKHECVRCGNNILS